jgi:hypothetical protein
MGSSQSSDNDDATTNNYDHAPTPTGQEYDLIDKIVSDLPYGVLLNGRISLTL